MSLQPIIAYISNTVISFIGIFYQGWNDGIYRQAAGSTLFSSLYLIVTILTTFPVATAVGLLVGGFLGTKISPSGARLRETFWFRIVRRITVLSAALMVPSVLIINARLYAEFQATATFDQRLMALEPVISDQERKELRGQWAMMKGRADYDNRLMHERPAYPDLVYKTGTQG